MLKYGHILVAICWCVNATAELWPGKHVYTHTYTVQHIPVSDSLKGFGRRTSPSSGLTSEQQLKSGTANRRGSAPIIAGLLSKTPFAMIMKTHKHTHAKQFIS